MNLETNRKLDISVNRKPIWIDPATTEEESGAPHSIDYDFRIRLGLSLKEYGVLEDYVSKIQPNEPLKAEAKKGAIYYNLEKSFSLIELVEFDEEEFIKTQAEEIAREIREHIHNLSAVWKIRKLAHNSSYTHQVDL